MPRLNFISRYELDEIKHKHALKKCQDADDTLEKALDKYVESKACLDDLRHIYRLRHLVTQIPSATLSRTSLEQDGTLGQVRGKIFRPLGGKSIDKDRIKLDPISALTFLKTFMEQE